MKKGFTLVELLIVIAIMGILTSITVAQFVTAKKKANDVARKSDLNGISKALQMYYTDYGVMPYASMDGKMEIIKGSSINWGGEFVDAGYIYMKVLPKENNTKFPAYCYKTDLERKKYAVFAQLENINDKECDGHVYKCGSDLTKTYCFAYVSPNTSLNTAGDLL